MLIIYSPYFLQEGSVVSRSLKGESCNKVLTKYETSNYILIPKCSFTQKFMAGRKI
jgi:hypothetical protein